MPNIPDPRVPRSLATTTYTWSPTTLSPTSTPISISKTHHASNFDIAKCQNNAHFFARMRHHNNWLIIMMMVLPFCVLLCVLLARACVYRPPTPAPVESDAVIKDLDGGELAVVVPAGTFETGEEETSIPAPKGVDGVDGDVEPPPYDSASASTSQEAATAPIATVTIISEKAKSRPSSARSFVVGSFLMLLALISLVLLAFTIPTLLYCSAPEPDTLSIVLSWLWFSAPALLILLGLGNWMLLFRNLFGKKTRQKWEFNEWMLLLWICVGVLMPFVAVGMGAMSAGEKAVQGCQRWCCSEGLEDEEEEIGGSGEGGVELQRAVVRDGVEGIDDEERRNGSGSIDRDEERVGLIAGTEK